MLSSIYAISAFLRFPGNPLYITGYCHLMLGRSLGEAVLSSAPRSKTYQMPPPCPSDTIELPLDQQDCKTEADGGKKTESNKEEVDGNIFTVVQAQTTGAAALTEGETEERQHPGAGRRAELEKEGTRPVVSSRTVFRCGGVYVSMEGRMP